MYKIELAQLKGRNSMDQNGLMLLLGMLRDKTAVVSSIGKARTRRPVEVHFQLDTKRTKNGSVDVEITKAGSYRVTVDYPAGDSFNESTYVEESIHLIHALVNSTTLFDLAEEDLRIQKMFPDFDPGELPIHLSSLRTTEFLAKVESLINTYLSLIPEIHRPELPRKRDVLCRLLSQSLSSSYFPGYSKHIEDLNAAVYKLVSDWGFIDTSDLIEVDRLQEQLNNDRYDALMAIQEKKGTLVADDHIAIGERFSATQRQISEMKSSSLTQMEQSVAELSDAQVNDLFERLGLRPLLTLEKFSVVRQALKFVDAPTARGHIESFIQISCGRQLGSIHHIMRPAGYYNAYSDIVPFNDWMNTWDDKGRRRLCLDKLAWHNDKYPIAILGALLEAQISAEWAQGEVEHACITHPMFWDLPDDSDLHLNPEYLQLNLEAIQQAIESGDMRLPSVLLEMDQLSEQRFKHAPKMFVSNPDPALPRLIEKLQHENRIHSGHQPTGWTALASKVMHFLSRSIVFTAKHNHLSVDSALENFLGISAVWTEKENRILAANFLSELVTKSIRMYLTGEIDLDFGDELSSGGYNYLLSSSEPMIWSNVIGNTDSIWKDLVEQIVNSLRQSDNDGQLIIKILKAVNIADVAAIVGYEA